MNGPGESPDMPGRFTHVRYRGDIHEAADLIRGIIRHDQPAVTAHDYAAQSPAAALPNRLRSLLGRRAAATRRHGIAYQKSRGAAASFATATARDREQAASHGASIDDGIEL
jgi:hypothetical protein